MFFKTFIAAAALAISASAAQATVVFSNGVTPTAGLANEAVSWLQADNFKLASDNDIVGGAVWLESQSGFFGWDGTLNYFFFSAVNGKPGDILQSGLATVLAQIDTGVLAQGRKDNIQKVVFDLDTDFSATAGIDYFFGLQLGSRAVAWSGAGAGNGVETFFAGSLDEWSSTGRERAFTLDAATAAAVAEPGVAVLTMTGIAIMALTRGLRRQR